MPDLILFLKAHVSGYTKKDGTVVAAHEDKRGSRRENPFERAARRREAEDAMTPEALARKREQEAAKNKEYMQQQDAARVRHDSSKSRVAESIRASPMGRAFSDSERAAVEHAESGEMGAGDWTATGFALGKIADEAVSQGWKLRHVSKEGGRESSRYLIAPNGKEVRLSDHHVPDTEKRESQRASGFGSKWAGELVLRRSEWASKSPSDFVREMNDLVQDGEPMKKSLLIWGRFREPGEPTEAQKKSGRYKKRLYEWCGLKIRIENEAGTWRRGTGGDGTEWATLMKWGYGYFEDTNGVDGDEVDVYVGPRPDDAPMVYVVHQRCYGDWEKYDEDKCMVGFMGEGEAVDAFLACYDDPRFLGPVSAIPVVEFVAKVMATKDKASIIQRDPPPMVFLQTKTPAC